jgi:hypothetical protein
VEGKGESGRGRSDVEFGESQESCRRDCVEYTSLVAWYVSSCVARSAGRLRYDRGGHLARPGADRLGQGAGAASGSASQ